MKNGKNFLRTSRRDFLTFGGMLAVMASSNSILLADREVKESKETKPEVGRRPAASPPGGGMSRTCRKKQEPDPRSRANNCYICLR